MRRPRRGLTAWVSEWFWWLTGAAAATPGPVTVRDISDRLAFAVASDLVACRDVSDRVELTVVS